MNDILCDSLLEFKKTLSVAAEVQELSTFKLSDLLIDIDEEDEIVVSLKGIPLTDNAVRQLANRLRIKKSFFDFGYDMDREKYDQLCNSIKSIDPDIPIFVEIDIDISNKQFIDVIYFKYPTNLSIDHSKYIELLVDYFNNSPIEYDLIDSKVSGTHAYIDVVQKSTSFDVLKNDTWKSGSSVAFNSYYIESRPLFLRTVCTNGMYTRQEYRGIEIDHKNFALNSVRELLYESLQSSYEEIKSIILNKVKSLSNTNISVSELMSIINFVDKNCTVNKSKILDEYFPTGFISNVYNTNIWDKSDQWLATADSGYNGYEVFNNMTYIGSHTNALGLPAAFGRELNLYASNLLFKESYDLTQLAPKVTIQKP